MQGPVRFLHRNFFRRSHDAALRPAYARGEGPPPRRAEGRARRFRPRVPGPDRRRGTGGAAVNCPTTRCSTPAAAPRIGRGESALPRQDPGTKTQSLPFAALPHELRKDPRLKGNRTAIVLAAALLEYARSKPSCYPSNARLAEDLGVCQQTIRNALAALVAAGWVKVVLGPDQPNGRTIWLCWRCTQPFSNHPSNQPRIASTFPSTQSTIHSAH